METNPVELDTEVWVTSRENSKGEPMDHDGRILKHGGGTGEAAL